MAWMKHGLQMSLKRYAWKVKWRPDILGALVIMDETAPLTKTEVVVIPK